MNVDIVYTVINHNTGPAIQSTVHADLYREIQSLENYTGDGQSGMGR